MTAKLFTALSLAALTLLAWAHEIENPVLLIHGEKAHSRYFSEYAFQRMTGMHVVGDRMLRLFQFLSPSLNFPSAYRLSLQPRQ